MQANICLCISKIYRTCYCSEHWNVITAMSELLRLSLKCIMNFTLFFLLSQHISSVYYRPNQPPKIGMLYITPPEWRMGKSVMFHFGQFLIVWHLKFILFSWKFFGKKSAWISLYMYIVVCTFSNIWYFLELFRYSVNHI